MSNLIFHIITGLSGAGKTHAIRALEDLSFFVLIICRRRYCLDLRSFVCREKVS